MSDSFLDEYVIEIYGFPRYGKSGEYHRIQSMFKYDSNTPVYSMKDTIIPVSIILNKQDLPDINTMQTIINNEVPVMKRVIDYSNKRENWVFIPTGP